jgi:hypothetical protein
VLHIKHLQEKPDLQVVLEVVPMALVTQEVLLLVQEVPLQALEDQVLIVQEVLQEEVVVVRTLQIDTLIIINAFLLKWKSLHKTYILQ